MMDWLLVDYGETISTRLPAGTVSELANLAGQDPEEFLQRYWHARPEYDLGQAPEIYWSRVLGRGPSDLSPLIDALTRIDVHGWLSLNASTIRTLLAHARRTGTRLALLSNAPEPLAAAIDKCFWSRHFTHRFYSCRLGYAKPDPAAFTTALAHLGSDSRRVLFIDDRAANTLAATRLGMPAINFSSAAALARHLRRFSPCLRRPSAHNGAVLGVGGPRAASLPPRMVPMWIVEPGSSSDDAAELAAPLLGPRVPPAAGGADLGVGDLVRELGIDLGGLGGRVPEAPPSRPRWRRRC
jgi:putative hydrolase of the HAD superfamily